MEMQPVATEARGLVATADSLPGPLPATLPLTGETALERAEAFIEGIGPPQSHLYGRGIVICGGGVKYLPGAWICIQMLRRLGCELPIQLWHLGEKEIDDSIRLIFHPLGVECVDGHLVRHRHPVRILNGWELKPFAIIHSPFKEVLYLDADNVPVENPEYLFETPEFLDTGAVFWPDFGRLASDRAIWRLCGVEYRDEPEFESGQILVDKERCWRALQLTMWYNEYSDYFYKHMHGDKETFHMAWRKLGQAYSMPSKRIRRLVATMCQHDFKGRRVFQHRNLDKWSLFRRNRCVRGFAYEAECLEYLEALRRLWPGRTAPDLNKRSEAERETAKEIVSVRFLYRRVGYDQRPMTFRSDGFVEEGAAGCEVFWDVVIRVGRVALEISSETELTCRLFKSEDGTWSGRWENFERMPIELIPIPRTRAFADSSRQRIVFHGPVNGFTGYGLHSCQIVQGLVDFGFEVMVKTMEFDQRYSGIPRYITDRIVYGEFPYEWELLLHPPCFHPAKDKKTLFFTMWETTRISAHAAALLNKAECVVVPSTWNADSFRACGVKKPIRIVPLGININVFTYYPMDMQGPCIFGAAGRMDGGGVRKGLNDVIRVFQRAFPNEKDVRLKIKAFPDCTIATASDPRVEVTKRFISEIELAHWFQGITCFVSASRCEGWGLMQQQALATGRPVISTKFGGITEFFDERVGYCVDYRLKAAEGHYAGCGEWAEPDEKHMIKQMHRVYQDRDEARRLGIEGAVIGAKYTWRKSIKSLLQVMKEIGMIP